MKTKNTIKITIITVLCILVLGCRNEECDCAPPFGAHVSFDFDNKSTADYAVEIDASTLSPNLRFIHKSGIAGVLYEENELGNKAMIKLDRKDPKQAPNILVDDTMDFGIDINIDKASIKADKEYSFDAHIYKNGKRFQSKRITFIAGVTAGSKNLGYTKKLCISDLKNLLFLDVEGFVISFKYPNVDPKDTRTIGSKKLTDCNSKK